MDAPSSPGKRERERMRACTHPLQRLERERERENIILTDACLESGSAHTLFTSQRERERERGRWREMEGDRERAREM
jgi:hypothetical protein